MASATEISSPNSRSESDVNGTCHHDCPDSCGWTASVADGVAVKLRGNPRHPYSKGELCPKVNRFLDRVYAPDRVLYPMRRVGPKGVGQFERIGWDDALDEIATRLRAVIDHVGAEAVLPFSSAGNQSLLATRGLSSRFFNRMGATQLDRGICGPTAAAGLAMTNGTAKAADALDLIHSRLIILWGTNTRLTNRHLWPTIESARAAGARLVVIDPVRTITAEAADQHIAPRPGTDIALMLAMMHVIIADDLVDRPWVEDHTLGYPELSTHVASWTPERAAAETGVSAETITKLAHDYANIRPAAIRTLIGAEHHRQGAMFFRTLGCLPALIGSWRQRGGGVMRSVGTWQDEMIDAAALAGTELLAGRAPRVINMGRLGEALTEVCDPAVEALFVWNANPAVTMPNSGAVRRGLARDDLFCVVHDQFITDTARYADIVLPATTQLETTDVVVGWGHLWLGWNEAAIEPRGEAVSNTELFRRLARAMNYNDACLYDDDETLLRAGLPDVDLDELRNLGWWKVPYPTTPTPFASGEFPTRSGKLEFVSERLAELGQPAVPDYVPAAGLTTLPNNLDADSHRADSHRADSHRIGSQWAKTTAADPGNTAAGDREFPLQLLAGKHHLRFLNSSYSHLPRHGGAEGTPFVELCPIDAEARRVNDGDLVTVFNQRARLDVTARISDRVGPGVALLPWGWWCDQHVDGHVANDLTNDAGTDWGSGTAYLDTTVEIVLAESSRPR